MADAIIEEPIHTASAGIIRDIKVVEEKKLFYVEILDNYVDRNNNKCPNDIIPMLANNGDGTLEYYIGQLVVVAFTTTNNTRSMMYGSNCDLPSKNNRFNMNNKRNAFILMPLSPVGKNDINRVIRSIFGDIILESVKKIIANSKTGFELNGGNGGKIECDEGGLFSVVNNNYSLKILLQTLLTILMTNITNIVNTLQSTSPSDTAQELGEYNVQLNTILQNGNLLFKS